MLTSISTLKAGDKILDFINQIQESGASMVHCDVMDGKFVKNVSMDLKMIEQIKLHTTLPLDVHLMVQNPKTMIKELTKNRFANIITVHYECFKNEKDLIATLNLIRKGRCLAGLSFDLNTNISDKIDLLKHCDLVLLMSVKAGEGGQKFESKTLSKVQVVKDYIKNKKLNLLVELDGGINLKNSLNIKNAGGDIIVLGTAFYEAKNKKEFITKII